MKTRHVSKVIDVFQRTLFVSIRHMKKEIQGSHYFTFFARSNLLTQACSHFCRTGQLTSSEHAQLRLHLLFINIHFFPLCAHILCFDAAKFSIKLFSLIYFTVSVVRQRDECEIMTETRPIKTRLRDQISSKMLICTKILIIEPLSYEIIYT